MAAAAAAKAGKSAASSGGESPVAPADEAEWPTLPAIAAPPPVDASGFAVDDLNAALAASMVETKRPKASKPRDGGETRAALAPDVVGDAGAGANDGQGQGPAAGLVNRDGEYNCFLNVVIQSLWHLPRFSGAVQLELPDTFGATRDPDVAVAASLCEVFAALDAESSSGATGMVAPTTLRKALAVLTSGKGALFSEHEMADASEALEAIFHAVHRALAPKHGGARARRAVSPIKSNSPGRGLFLDQECGYRSIVHECFGMDVEEYMACGECGVRSRTLRYTKFTHLVPATALVLAMKHAEGVITMEDAMRHIDGSDAKACDRDVGGCGVMNSIKHALGGAGGGDAAPRMFCLGLAWDSASVEKEQIVATLRHVSTTLDLGQVYERVPKTTPAYALRCVMCYYGEHYAAFARADDDDDADANDGGRWRSFDDATTKEVGGWDDVVRACEKGRLQPCVLFYQRGDAAGAAGK